MATFADMLGRAMSLGSMVINFMAVGAIVNPTAIDGTLEDALLVIEPAVEGELVVGNKCHFAVFRILALPIGQMAMSGGKMGRQFVSDKAD